MQCLTIEEIKKALKEMEMRNHKQITFDVRGANMEVWTRKNEKDGYWEKVELDS